MQKPQATCYGELKPQTTMQNWNNRQQWTKIETGKNNLHVDTIAKLINVKLTKKIWIILIRHIILHIKMAKGGERGGVSWAYGWTIPVATNLLPSIHYIKYFASWNLVFWVACSICVAYVHVHVHWQGYNKSLYIMQHAYLYPCATFLSMARYWQNQREHTCIWQHLSTTPPGLMSAICTGRWPRLLSTPPSTLIPNTSSGS